MRELDILAQILPTLQQRPEIPVGPGDDCAAIDLGGTYLLAAVDQMAAGVHYYPDTAPERIGAKLLKRNLSDIAAMGGTPAYALLALASSRADDQWYLDFYHGLETEARCWNVAVCGGDLGGLPAGGADDVMSLTILGKVAPDRICLRSNAQPGDLLYATGCFGNSLGSEHHLDFIPRLAEGEWLAANGFTRAMLDVSDGLLLDAGRLAKASGLALQLQLESIPRRSGADLNGALSDGEDYELLFAVAPGLAAVLEKSWPFPVRLTKIGTFSDALPGVYDTQGRDLLKELKSGYEHHC